MVLAASGVDHQQLLDVAEPLLSDWHKGSPMETPKSTYTGGDFRQKAESDVIFFLIKYSILSFETSLCSSLKFYSSLCLQMTHVALAFEVPGGWLKERDATIMTVIQV